jgi:hypothetical protein
MQVMNADTFRSAKDCLGAYTVSAVSGTLVQLPYLPNRLSFLAVCRPREQSDAMLNPPLARLTRAAHPKAHWVCFRRCTWQILGNGVCDGSESLSLQFVRFELETEYDVLTIYDGRSILGDLLGRYTGRSSLLQSPLQPILASSGCAVVMFASDSSVQWEGFEIRFSKPVALSAAPTAEPTLSAAASGQCAGLTTIDSSFGEISVGLPAKSQSYVPNRSTAAPLQAIR